MSSDLIRNINLLVAERLLTTAYDKPYLASGSGITLELEEMPKELSNEQIVEAIKRLEYRKAVGFDNEADKYEPESLSYINLYFNREKTDEFIDRAKNRFYGLLEEYKKKKELLYVLEALNALTKFNDGKIMTEFSALRYQYVDVAIWIADYSGAIGIGYEEEPDVEWKDLPRPQIVGVGEVAKKYRITDQNLIRKLETDIQEFLAMPQRKRIELLLKNKVDEVLWRCANCRHFLGIKLKEEKTIANYLNGFRINRFVICKKCRKRNYFSLDKKGKISFLITRKRTFTQIAKEGRVQKIKVINRTIRKLNKSGLLDQKVVSKIDNKDK